MEVAIALPNAVPGASDTQLAEWAQRAEGRGFSSLAANDRVAYGSYEPLTALAAAAGVTERIGLCTAIAIGPLRVSAAVLAKQALSLQALCGERLTLGRAGQSRIRLRGRRSPVRRAGAASWRR
jgi:alkanesulfonate monooxygenase SsuD/methylene tetrahydromethanopterin reductase-like flavin-dependent oxidoreductase (luciferase family)